MRCSAAFAVIDKLVAEFLGRPFSLTSYLGLYMYRWFVLNC